MREEVATRRNEVGEVGIASLQEQARRSRVHSGV